MRKRTIAISLSVLAAAGLAGGAYAASQSSSDPEQALINDAAHRLHISPSRLSGALKQALIDRINADVAAGHLSPAQAKIIKQRIEQGSGLPLLPSLGARPGFGFQFRAPGRFGPPPLPGPFGPPALLTSAASYLGLSNQQLMRQLHSGKTLAQIASARGKSRAGLESAITAGVKAQLERAVRAGRLPRAIEGRLFKLFSARVKDIVNGTRLGETRGGWTVGPLGPPPPKGRIGPVPPGAGLGPIPPPVIRGLL